MHEATILALAFVAGCGLGAAFFVGLWWTVRYGLTTSHPAMWMLASLLVRTAVLLVGFYFVAGGQWQRLLACALGFFTARLVATRLALPPQEVIHGP